MSRAEQITEPEVAELRATVRHLRHSLDQIVNEGCSNEQTCDAVINEAEHLRRDVEERKRERNNLLEGLKRARGGLAALEEQCAQEREGEQSCRQDAIRMERAMEDAKEETMKLRAEIEQMTHFQENVDTETMYRLQADVQNLEIEREQDAIKTRHLKSERTELLFVLEKVKAERDALHLRIPNEKSREFIEAEMEYDMQKARQEALIVHLEGMGMAVPKNLASLHKPDNLVTSFQELIKGLSKHISMNSGRLSPLVSPRGDCETKTKAGETNASKPQQQHVGGILMGADADDKTFFRQLPKVFKMGTNAEEFDYAPDNHDCQREINCSDAASCVSELSDEGEWIEKFDR